MKLLFVEDNPETVEFLRERIKEEGLAKKKPPVKKFKEAVKTIKEIRPDVIILDIFDGDPAKERKEGRKSLDFIWGEHFCPVIVYSAFPEEMEHEEHPFIHSVQKGRESEESVLEKLKEIKQHIDTIKSVEQYVHETFSSVLKEVAPYAFDAYEGNSREDALKRATRRRLAARMDELSNEDDKSLAPWEQYIFPPISTQFRLGDVLMEKARDSSDPKAFRIVLTPSCDLEKHNGIRKVKNVLVSRCCPMKKGIGKSISNLVKVPKNSEQKKGNEKKIKNLLSQGHSNGIIPLPALKDKIPSMAADLRDLQLIPVEKIGTQESPGVVEYVSVASLDSPFREMVSWAYLQIAGRPGLPDRDFREWIKEILEECEEGRGN